MVAVRPAAALPRGPRANPSTGRGYTHGNRNAVYTKPATSFDGHTSFTMYFTPSSVLGRNESKYFFVNIIGDVTWPGNVISLREWLMTFGPISRSATPFLGLMSER